MSTLLFLGYSHRIIGGSRGAGVAAAPLVSLNSSLNYCSIKHKSSLNLHYQSTCPLLSPLLDVILDPPLLETVPMVVSIHPSLRGLHHVCLKLMITYIVLSQNKCFENIRMSHLYDDYHNLLLKTTHR